MRAVEVTGFGGPEVLVPVRAPRPVAGAGEALIGVDVVDIGFVETQIRAGWGQEYFSLVPPYIPGWAFAGTVRAVREGVDPGLLGRRVAVSTAGTAGGAAEFALAAADSLAPVPDGLPLSTAAALVHDGTTALALLDRTGLAPGERLLIVGASGGMGTLLVQLAKARGAFVVGLARGDRKTSLVRELGADAAIDTTDRDWRETARTALGAAGADVVLDGVGGAPGLAAFPLTADGGRFSAHGAPTGGFAPVEEREAAARGIRLTGISELQLDPKEARSLLTEALTLAAGGPLHPVIGALYPLERTAEAHRAIEDRTMLGKVLLTTAPTRTASGAPRSR